MFDLVTQKRKDQKLTYEDLVIAKVSIFSFISLFLELVILKFSHLLLFLLKN